MKSTKPKTKDDSKWPKVYTRRYPSGQVAYIVDLGIINGKRERYTKETLEEARTYAKQARIKQNNESLAAFALSSHIQRDAQQAHEKLKPYDISLTTAADYYIKHVVAYRNALPAELMRLDYQQLSWINRPSSSELTLRRNDHAA